MDQSRARSSPPGRAGPGAPVVVERQDGSGGPGNLRMIGPSGDGHAGWSRWSPGTGTTTTTSCPLSSYWCRESVLCVQLTDIISERRDNSPHGQRRSIEMFSSLSIFLWLPISLELTNKVEEVDKNENILFYIIDIEMFRTKYLFIQYLI